jgi:hypothetical protein
MSKRFRAENYKAYNGLLLYICTTCTESSIVLVILFETQIFIRIRTYTKKEKKSNIKLRIKS